MEPTNPWQKKFRKKLPPRGPNSLHGYRGDEKYGRGHLGAPEGWKDQCDDRGKPQKRDAPDKRTMRVGWVHSVLPLGAMCTNPSFDVPFRPVGREDETNGPREGFWWENKKVPVSGS